MIGIEDDIVWRAFEESAIVRRIERGARTMRTAAANSRLIAAGRSWSAGAAAWPGHLLLSAVLTHVLLTVAIARPASWQWIILPSMAAVVGVVLIAFSRQARIER